MLRRLFVNKLKRVLLILIWIWTVGCGAFAVFCLVVEIVGKYDHSVSGPTPGGGAIISVVIGAVGWGVLAVIRYLLPDRLE